MAILVTGGSGYIGSQLIRDLSKEFPGETIRILDSMMREKYVSLWNLEGKFEFIEGDVRNKETLKKAFEDVNTVFDLVGITNAPISFERKDLTMDVNVNGVKQVLENVLKNDAKYVYSSTASVYGDTNGEIVDEEVECHPQSPYGESKLLAEAEIKKIAEENGLKPKILRMSTVHGWSPGIRFDIAANKFAYFACVGMPMTVWSSAVNELRPYVHVRDSSKAYIHALKKDLNGTFNVVSQNVRMGDLIEIVKKNVPTARFTITEASKSQSSYALTGEKFNKTGFKATIPMDTGIKEICEKFSGFLK